MLAGVSFQSNAAISIIVYSMLYIDDFFLLQAIDYKIWRFTMTPPLGSLGGFFTDWKGRKMPQTGEKCVQGGLYKCSTHPANVIPLAKGETFPPCAHGPGGGHRASWILVQKDN